MCSLLVVERSLSNLVLYGTGGIAYDTFVGAVQLIVKWLVFSKDAGVSIVGKNRDDVVCVICYNYKPLVVYSTL